MDDIIQMYFPPGSKLISAESFGTSAWTATSRLSIQLPDGAPKLYFLKCAVLASGRALVEGKHAAQSELYKTMPDLVLEPYGWSRFQQRQPETYFFLSEFVDMKTGDIQRPDAEQLCEKLAKLHRGSISPTGMFGLYTTTYQGHIPQAVSWERSWTIFFSKLFRHVLASHAQSNGVWTDLETLAERALDRVVPRLLNALESEGRKVKPCLIHGNIWEGNIGTSAETGEIYIFDSAAYYAHNEMELGEWRNNHNKIHDKVYTRTYLRRFPPSEPVEEWDDRNRLYSVYYNLLCSVINRDQGLVVRQMAYDDLYCLIDKYTPFETGTGPQRLVDSERARLSDERDHTKHPCC
ncbi:hypothetical protein BDW74DRAFT_169716 [Aspergillus multicolor]|uniref:uncharacterized protein n=1 Tax=Aspergillus multicolor TaxID=41759 RepID=UPI003CCD721D